MANKNYLSIYAKSFNWAGFFLPNKVYLKCSALYDFCRVADNIADSNNSIDIKKKKFLEFKNDFNLIDRIMNFYGLRFFIDEFGLIEENIHDFDRA